MKINLNTVWGFDSITYRKIFEFIQKEGIEPFIKLVDDIASVRESELVNAAIFQRKQPTAGLVRRNKVVVEFLRQFQSYFLNPGFDNTGINNTSFREFITSTSNNMDKLSKYIENSIRLEELKICHIKFANLKDHWLLQDTGFGRVQVWSKSGSITTIRKNYTDGIISYNPIRDRNYEEEGYEEFGVNISPNKTVENSPTWLLQCENHEDGRQFRYALIEDFAFNGEQLPTGEELSSYEEPQTLKTFRKQNI